MTQWFRNYSRLRNISIKFLLIPEQHKDGAWHIHGFLHGLPADHLTPFTMQDHLPHYIRDKLAKNQVIYNWEAYAKKFGYCNIEAIRNEEAASKYLLKYITKDLSRCVREINAHMYYCSRGLQRAVILKKGMMTERFTDLAPIDYENDYVRVAWLSNDEETLQRLFAAIQSDSDKREAARAATQTASH